MCVQELPVNVKTMTYAILIKCKIVVLQEMKNVHKSFRSICDVLMRSQIMTTKKS